MIYTFYSFKGGVGRSMALANIAELFYRRGLKVLMVDFDLEAPGLERYFNVDNAQLTTTEILGRRGIIDLLISYKQLCSLPKMAQENGMNHDSSKEVDRLVVEPLEDFCLPIYQENQSGGELFLIPAGRRGGDYFKKYAENVQSFDWQDFYINWEGEKFFDWFRETAELFADVVLIDSRTGITEMGGICTHQLADVVLMFVGANQQNLDGTLKMATSLSQKDLIESGRKGRKLSLIPIPSRIDSFEAESLDEFARSFKSTLGQFFPEELNRKANLFTELKIPYLPYYAYQEKVAVRETGRDSAIDLTKAFERIILSLVSLSPKDSYLNQRINSSLLSILFINSSSDDIHLQFEQELRDIAKGLRRSQQQDRFNLEQKWAVRPRDIQRAMLDLQPQIVHFSGHGDGEAGLVFEDEVGNSKLVDGAALAGLFELFADQLHCVMLNGCYSEVQAKAISQHIPYVIGMNQTIGDQAAIAFAVGFYDALGAGRDVEFAFKLGCSAIRLEGIAEHLTPVLLKKQIPIMASAFISGKPIEHPKNFFGREKELKRLFNVLKTHPLQNAVIIGKRGSGKTSLLNYLRRITTTPADQLRPRQKFDWLPNHESYRWIFVDFQDVRMAQQERLLRYLLESMKLSVPDICDLEGFMDQVSGNVHQPTVILLDEVQRCSELDIEFWEVLRALVTNQTGGNLAIVLASSENPVNWKERSIHTSPLFNILHTIRLRTLTEGEARELINSSPLTFAAADIDWILKKSDSWPLLLQILCQERLFYLQDDDFSDDWRKEGLEKVAQYSDLFKTRDTA